MNVEDHLQLNPRNGSSLGGKKKESQSVENSTNVSYDESEWKYREDISKASSSILKSDRQEDKKFGNKCLQVPFFRPLSVIGHYMVINGSMNYFIESLNENVSSFWNINEIGNHLSESSNDSVLIYGGEEKGVECETKMPEEDYNDIVESNPIGKALELQVGSKNHFSDSLNEIAWVLWNINEIGIRLSESPIDDVLVFCFHEKVVGEVKGKQHLRQKRWMMIHLLSQLSATTVKKLFPFKLNLSINPEKISDANGEKRTTPTRTVLYELNTLIKYNA